MKFIIMCGGAGSKLWPMSRSITPKHFISIVGKKTLFQMNIEALLERYSAYDIFVSTSSDLIHFVKEQAPEIPEENYIIEPRLNKDSGPASCYAMAKVNWKYPGEVVYFYVQSPIVRKPTDKYIDMVEGMEQLVLDNNILVTGTQIPRYVETGSDLLTFGSDVYAINNLKAHKTSGFIDVVKNRMNYEEVQDIMRSNSVGTHSNHYTWKAEPFFAAVKKYNINWYTTVQKLIQVFGLEDEQSKINTIYSEFEPGRIELVTKQLMINGEVIAVEMPYRWTHITTWDDVYKFYEEEGIDIHQTEVIEVGKDGNLVLSEDKRTIALVDIQNMIIIDTKEALLICPRDKVSKIADLHDNLKIRGRDDLL